MAIKIQMNKTVKGIEKLRIYLRGQGKFGKTSLFRNVVLENFNGDATKGLLVGVGNEIGYTLLDNLQTTHCNTWKDLKELQLFLIKGKGTEHNIELVAFDTVDEILPIVEKEVCRLSQIQTGKPCDSINKALGGYGKGQEKVKELLKEYFTTLYKAGFGITCISHTKLKTIVEKGKNEDEGYQTLTSNLPNTYETIFADVFDCVLTGVIDKDIVDGKIESTNRKLYFRGNTFIDAGCRFDNGSVPEYILVDDNPKQFAKDFIHTLKEGMRESASNPISDKEYEKEVQEEKKQAEKDLKQVQEEVEQQEKEEEQTNIDELKSQLKEKLKTLEAKNIVKEYMKEKNIKSIASLNVEQLQEILAKLQ